MTGNKWTKEQVEKAQSLRDELAAAKLEIHNIEVDGRENYSEMTRSEKMAYSRNLNSWKKMKDEIEQDLKDSPPSPMSPTKATELVMSTFQRKVDFYAEELVKFQERVANSPSYAMKWGGSIVKAEWSANLSQGAIQSLEREEGTELERWYFVLEMIDSIIEGRNREQRGYYGNHSTSMFSNAVEQAEAQERANALDHGWLNKSRFGVDYLGEMVSVWELLQ